MGEPLDFLLHHLVWVHPGDTRTIHAVVWSCGLKWISGELGTVPGALGWSWPYAEGMLQPSHSLHPGEVICEPPNNKLDKFGGMLYWKENKYPLSNQNMLLRGCVLRNTEWCFGLVIFAGGLGQLLPLHCMEGRDPADALPSPQGPTRN